MENISMSEFLFNLYAWFHKNGGFYFVMAILFFLFALSVVHGSIQAIWGIQPI